MLYWQRADGIPLLLPGVAIAIRVFHGFNYFQDAWQMFVSSASSTTLWCILSTIGYCLLQQRFAIARQDGLVSHPWSFDRPVTCIIGGYDAEHMATVGGKAV